MGVYPRKWDPLFRRGHQSTQFSPYACGTYYVLPVTSFHGEAHPVYPVYRHPRALSPGDFDDERMRQRKILIDTS